jgi:DNA-binding PucR family transcriptional regulator
VRVRVGEFLEAERVVLAPSAQAALDAGAEPETPLHELLLSSVPAPVLRSFSDRLLGPLQEYDDRHNAELTSTLRSFLACDGSWSACASLMFVHVNTVRYRMSRVEALTGRDLSALADRVDFFLALRGQSAGTAFAAMTDA